MANGGVVSTGPELADTSIGDSQQPGGDVIPTGQPQFTPDPSRDIARLQSKYDSRIAQLERSHAEQVQRYEQQVQMAQLSDTVRTRAAELEATYAAQGYDAQTARQYAVQYAQQEAQQQYRVQTLERENQTYKQQVQQQQIVSDLDSLSGDICDDTGLTPDELAQATGHLRYDAPGFVSQAWKLANAAARTKAQQGQAQGARTLRGQVPFVSGGFGAAGPGYAGLPEHIQSGTREAVNWIEQQMKNRYR